MLKLHLPNAVISFTSTVGSSNTFLAMVMIWIGLELRLSPKKLKTAFRYLGIRHSFALIFAIMVGITVMPLILVLFR